MDLQTFVKILRKRWRILPVAVVVVVALVGAITYVLPRSYQSQVQFFVSTVDSSDNSQLAQGSTFLQQRVKSYAQLVAAPVVLKPVVQGLKLDTSADDLGTRVSASIPADTVLIDVTVHDSNARTAQAIANAIGRQFPRSVAQLEQVPGAGNSPVKVTVTKPATLSLAPISPKPARNLAFAAVLGMLFGLATALLRHSLDTKVRTKDDIETLANGTAILGSIPYDGDASKHALILGAATRSSRAESFRSLRTNLAFVGAAENVRSIVVTSSLPGEGKTTTTANLALMLAESGSRVCLVEGDLRRPKLLDYFGLDGSAGLTDILIGRANAVDVLQPYGKQDLMLLGAGSIPPNPSELLASAVMRNVLQDLYRDFDYVLVDAAPLLPVTDAAVLSTHVDGALMVVGSGLVTKDQLRTALDSLMTVEARLLGVALNRTSRSDNSDTYYDYRYEYAARRKNESATPVSGWDRKSADAVDEDSTDSLLPERSSTRVS
ncbi:polysaccharide biosynthesis tyrosine autokinase [Microlunatus endophyticus]|uniref:polysaccharide biosynthesis tyrosine autokinase n=1 Tax=Microlunatus endophyticus TaxID=1716077 RepID=UPI0016675750|nr:polysaccharide biosynthesis tyrosine autokinase [Microlunatus endophyticus]